MLHSDEHPDLWEIGSTKTKNCVKAYQRKYKLNKPTTSQEKQKQSKVRRLSNLGVCEFVVENNIHTDVELFAKAKEQKGVSHLSKSLQDLLSNAWKMESSTATLARKATTRMEVVRKCATEDCVKGCNGEWLVCAEQVCFLTQNVVHPVVNASALKDVLVKNQGTKRNIMIVGPAKYAKTFLFKTLQIIFKDSSNHSNDKYA